MHGETETAAEQYLDARRAHTATEVVGARDRSRPVRMAGKQGKGGRREKFTYVART